MVRPFIIRPFIILINGAPPDSRIGEFYFKSLTAENEFNPVWQEVVTRRDMGFPRFDQHLWFPAQTVTPTYDDDGNLTGDGRWVYLWDAENRLIQMENNPTAPGQPIFQAIFKYDWQGRRVARQVFRWEERLKNHVLTSHRWLYDGWNVVAEFSATDLNSSVLTRSKSYTWGLDLSGTLQGAGGVGGLLSVQTHAPQSAIHYPSYDGNGNIIAWTQNDASAPAARREYDAFGNTLVAEGTAPCDFGFSTKMREEMTGLYYYGYRFYDPLAGRWLSRDPIEELGSTNLNAFSENCPTSKIDVLGKYSVMFPPSGQDPIAGIIWRLSQLLQGDYLLPRFLNHWMNGGGSSYYLTYGEFSYVTRDENGVPIWSAHEFPEVERAAFKASNTGGCATFSSRSVNYGNKVVDNSMGRFNLKVEGKVCCILENGRKKNVITGTVEIRDESFDFDLSKDRSLAGEVKTLVGWLFLRGGGKQFTIHQMEQIDFSEIDIGGPSY